MTEAEKLERKKKITKICMIALTVSFIVLMLIIPLITVITGALKEGLSFYIKAVSTEYVANALKVTLIATVFALAVNTLFGLSAAWVLTKFSFRGKQFLATLIDIPFSISPVIAGLAFLMTFGRLGFAYPVIRWINETFGWNIRITFALPGVILATIFVTFPYVSRLCFKRNHSYSQCRRKRRRRGSSAYGCWRIQDFHKDHPATDKMGTCIRNYIVYGKGFRRVWCGKCLVKDKR